MKRLIPILLLLLLPFALMAEEKVWYCTTESGVGLIAQDNTSSWGVVPITSRRMTVTQKSDKRFIFVHSSFPETKYDFWDCQQRMLDQAIFACFDTWLHVAFNTRTGYLSWGQLQGKVHQYDPSDQLQLGVIAYKCEIF